MLLSSQIRSLLLNCHDDVCELFSLDSNRAKIKRIFKKLLVRTWYGDRSCQFACFRNYYSTYTFGSCFCTSKKNPQKPPTGTPAVWQLLRTFLFVPTYVIINIMKIGQMMVFNLLSCMSSRNIRYSKKRLYSTYLQ